MGSLLWFDMVFSIQWWKEGAIKGTAKGHPSSQKIYSRTMGSQLELEFPNLIVVNIPKTMERWVWAVFFPIETGDVRWLCEFSNYGNMGLIWFHLVYLGMVMGSYCSGGYSAIILGGFSRIIISCVPEIVGCVEFIFFPLWLGVEPSFQLAYPWHISNVNMHQ